MCAPDDVSGSFLLNHCMCDGTEETLFECNPTKDVADCIDREAVMVNCTGKYSAIHIFIRLCTLQLLVGIYQ